MATHIVDSGWSRLSSALDVELLHGVPIRVSNSDTSAHIDEKLITDKISALTGLSVSVCDWISLSAKEQEWSVYVDKKEFSEVLHRLALASAAMFVDRYHKSIGRNAVDWDSAEFNYDFNHALEHCGIPWDTLNKSAYFERYVTDMHEESVRLINSGIAPQVEAE
jgi:hypothetical protein